MFKSMWLLFNIQIIPCGRCLLLVDANSDVVSRIATISNLPTTRSKLIDLDVICTHLVCFSIPKIVLFTLSHCDICLEKVNFVYKYCGFILS